MLEFSKHIAVREVGGGGGRGRGQGVVEEEGGTRYNDSTIN